MMRGWLYAVGLLMLLPVAWTAPGEASAADVPAEEHEAGGLPQEVMQAPPEPSVAVEPQADCSSDSDQVAEGILARAAEESKGNLAREREEREQISREAEKL